MKNIRTVCSKHAPKPIGLDASIDPTSLIGRHVKIGIDVDRAKVVGEAPDKEHIWIKINSVEDKKLIGIIDNNPLYIPYKLGEKISITIDQIEDIYAEGSACPKCEMTSHNPTDVKMEWCDNCKSFHWALGSEEPIYFNAIVNSLQDKVRRRLADGAPFRLSFEQYKFGTKTYWRALIVLGTGVWSCSRNPQKTPADALRELSEIMDAL